MAAKAFEELFEKFPNGQRAERAAWKSGWWGYKNGEYAETVRVFESRRGLVPAVGLPAARSSTGRLARTASSARAQTPSPGCGSSSPTTAIRTTAGSPSGTCRVSAQRRSTADAVPAAAAVGRRAAPPSRQPTGVIRLLLASGLYDDALNELRYAQRTWRHRRRSIDATIAWAYHQKGELRRAITLMRRAYPQHPDRRIKRCRRRSCRSSFR